ncbi:oxidoreductase-like domain-containing protein [Chitiniphilus eburneus]|uniref:Oxidoreductase n=1 Tax=Chitiniphilus eburneus TaxID=2571148 RepID=A0A4U0PBT4_9NEIS|nr:oxidoreductase-like domain-containing protein [Chitiniphilus eburneus]TJZ65175.1 oxidoreductase [Chitiniphilus eburneus]
MNSQLSPATPDADDPRPEPPLEPALEECCGSGCDPCIFDTYAAALQRYREALMAWEARQTERGAPQ